MCRSGWHSKCRHTAPASRLTLTLKPLGNPAANAIKFFATADLQDAVEERSLLAKLTNIINQQWADKNAEKNTRFTDGGLNARPVFELYQGQTAGNPLERVMRTIKGHYPLQKNFK